MREGIWQGFEELTFDRDGSTGYRFNSSAADLAAAESGDLAERETGRAVEWTCDADSDDLELSITPEALANLVARARTHCPGCDGQCGRQG